MKKILLTLIAGFCFGSLAMAQEPAKAAKKKAKQTSVSATPANDAAKVQAKEAKAKAYESGSAAPTAQSDKFSKAPVAKKAN